MRYSLQQKFLELNLHQNHPEGLLKRRLLHSAPVTFGGAGLNLHIRQAPENTDAADAVSTRPPDSRDNILKAVCTESFPKPPEPGWLGAEGPGA